MIDMLPHDDELQKLYRGLPTDEPGLELDARILNAARRRASDDTRRKLVRRIRWSVPLAAAAGVVLTLTLTKLTPNEGCIDCAAPIAAVAPAPAPESLSDDAAHDAAQSEAPSAETGGAYSEPMEAEEMPLPAATGAVTTTPSRKDNAAPANRTASGGAAAMMAKRKTDAPQARQESSKATAPEQDSSAVYGEPEEAPSPTAASPSLAAAASAQPSSPATDNLVAEKARVTAPWPFHLEAGLAADEACRRATAAVHQSCAFRLGVAIVDLPVPAVVDAGTFRGRRTTRLVLTAGDGKLYRVTLSFVDAADETLAAPEPAH